MREYTFAFDDYYQLLLRHDAVIYERHESGETYQAIGQDMGISASAAQAASKHWGWDIIQRNLKWQREIAGRRTNGESYESIATAMDLDVRQVKYLDTSWRRRYIARTRENSKQSRLEYGYA